MSTQHQEEEDAFNRQAITALIQSLIKNVTLPLIGFEEKNDYAVCNDAIENVGAKSE